MVERRNREHDEDRQREERFVQEKANDMQDALKQCLRDNLSVDVKFDGSTTVIVKILFDGEEICRAVG